MKCYKIVGGKLFNRDGAALHVSVSPQLKIQWRALRPLVSFAFHYCRRIAAHQFKGIGLPSDLYLKITNGSSWRGRAWPFRKRCLVRIGSQDFKPFLSVYPRYKDMPEFWISNWEERVMNMVSECDGKLKSACLCLDPRWSADSRRKRATQHNL